MTNGCSSVRGLRETDTLSGPDISEIPDPLSLPPSTLPSASTPFIRAFLPISIRSPSHPSISSLPSSGVAGVCPRNIDASRNRATPATRPCRSAVAIHSNGPKSDRERVGVCAEPGAEKRSATSTLATSPSFPAEAVDVPAKPGSTARSRTPTSSDLDASFASSCWARDSSALIFISCVLISSRGLVILILLLLLAPSRWDDAHARAGKQSEAASGG